MNDLDANDVISMNPKESFTKTSTFRFHDLKIALREHFRTPTENWVNGQDVKCEVLRTTGGGWKRGRMRLRLEFIPDDPEQTDQPNQ